MHIVKEENKKIELFFVQSSNCFKSNTILTFKNNSLQAHQIMIK